MSTSKHPQIHSSVASALCSLVSSPFPSHSKKGMQLGKIVWEHVTCIPSTSQKQLVPSLPPGQAQTETLTLCQEHAQQDHNPQAQLQKRRMLHTTYSQNQNSSTNLVCNYQRSKCLKQYFISL